MPDSPVIDDSDEFRPMPLPGGVVSGDDADKLTPVPFQFSDIRALAARILKRAQEQAEQKLAAARSQIAQMEKAAQDKAYKEAFPKGEKAGFAKGEKDGKAAGEAEVKKRVESELAAFKKNTEPVGQMLRELMQAINEHRQFLIAQAESDLLLLAVDIAKRLVARELSFDPEAIRPLAIEAIGLTAERSNIQMRVNPEDLKVMEDELPDLKAIFPDLGAVHLEADPSIERGGLVAATREAEVDMRLATRLAAFEEAILGFSGKEAEAPWGAFDPKTFARQPQERVLDTYSPSEPPAQSPPSETAAVQPPAAPAPEPAATPEPAALSEPAAAIEPGPAADAELSHLIPPANEAGAGQPASEGEASSDEAAPPTDEAMLDAEAELRRAEMEQPESGG